MRALTERECQVLRLVADGMTDKYIGTALGISHKTVQQHMVKIRGKLEVANRAGAVAVGLRTGEIT